MNTLDELRGLSRPIAFANYSKDKDLGGVTAWLETLLLRLHRDGVPVVLLLHSYETYVPQFGVWSRLREAGIPVEIESSPIEDEAAHPDRYVRKTIQFLNRYYPLVFVPNCRNALYFAAQLLGRKGLPWVFPIHSDDPLFWNVASALSLRTSKGTFVGGSRYICQQVKERGLARTSVLIPYGVPIPSTHASFSASPFRVVYAGRLIEEQKRISLVLKSLALACQMDDRIECLVMGDGPEFEPSCAWVKRQGLSERIRFSGRLEMNEFRKSIATCQAILMMSDYEGLPISLLEAMACGVVPVVRLIPSGIPELVKHHETGFLVDENPQNAASALVRLVEDSGLWGRFSKASAHLVADHYSEDSSYQRWVNLLAQLAKQSSATYPLVAPKRIPIPLRYDPVVLQGRKIAVMLKWNLLRIWYAYILKTMQMFKKIIFRILDRER